MDLQHRFQERCGSLRISIRQVEDPNDLLLVFALFVRRIRIDQHRLGVDHLHRQLVGARDQLERVLHARLAQVDRDSRFAAKIAIENEVDAA